LWKIGGEFFRPAIPSTVFFKVFGGKMKNRFVLFLGATLLILSGCHYTTDIKAERIEATSVVNQMIQALETKDMDLFSKITAHDADMVNFGTDAAERWVGWDALKKAVGEQFAAFAKIKLDVTDQTVQVAPFGHVAWFYEVVDWDLVSQGQPTHIKGSRITGVLEKRDTHWKIVQFHVSVPVSSQAAKY
jgi:hypothetical protein